MHTLTYRSRGLYAYASNAVARELQGRDTISNSQDVEPPILFPMEVIVHPLALRFKYHFNGDKPTNRFDKVPKTPALLYVNYQI